jgi:hypothetical protein
MWLPPSVRQGYSMKKTTGVFREIEVRLSEVAPDKWIVEFKDRSDPKESSFAIFALMGDQSDVKTEALALVAKQVGLAAKTVRREMRWT